MELNKDNYKKQEKEEIEILDDKLYIAKYGIPIKGDPIKIWNEIKKRPNVLKEATKVIDNKWKSGKIVKGLAICDSMLIDYKNVDKEAYDSLIKAIYTYPDVARISIDKGYSFLLMSLWNDSVKLTQKQKDFVISEAMQLPGTVQTKYEKDSLEKELIKFNITDDITVSLEFSGKYQPIGAKSGIKYFQELLDCFKPQRVHGSGDFDIRYNILRNSNWSQEEKQKLVYLFWSDQAQYDETLDAWEWNIVNDSANYKDDNLPQIEKDDLLNYYTYEMLLEFYQEKETTDRIFSEIQFCQLMHKLRPMSWEIEEEKKYKK